MHAYLLQLPISDYRQVLNLQLEVIARQAREERPAPILILAEHLPVFTLGKQGGKDHLKVSEQFLAAQGIKLIQVKRGGFITYHGPGQLVAYLLGQLKSLKITVPGFIDGLEQVMLLTASDYGVAARRDRERRGLWVGPRKLGSLGIAIKRGITHHGLALNISLDLAPFSWINACGLAGTKATSLAQETGRPLAMPAAAQKIIANFQTVFDLQLEEINLDRLDQAVQEP